MAHIRDMEIAFRQSVMWRAKKRGKGERDGHGVALLGDGGRGKLSSCKCCRETGGASFNWRSIVDS
jgi:hypothetical protein